MKRYNVSLDASAPDSILVEDPEGEYVRYDELHRGELGEWGEGTNRRPADAAPAGPVGEASEWLIWSNEHRAWWGPDRCGYPPQPHLAGRYTLTEARYICQQRHWLGGCVPPETMIHQDELPPTATARLE